ncbi:hypothetical protein [Streptomyces sp. NPDC096132]
MARLRELLRVDAPECSTLTASVESNWKRYWTVLTSLIAAPW